MQKSIYIFFVDRLSHRNSARDYNGPFFNKWSPSGSNDSVKLLEDEHFRLDVYFKREFADKDGWLVQSTSEIQEISDERMSYQEIHTAGCLRGILEVKNIPVEVFNCFSNWTNDDFLKSTKAEELDVFWRKVTIAVSSIMKKFVSYLIVSEGQYWLESNTTLHEEQDHKRPLCYLDRIQASWSFDKKNWIRIRNPEPQELTVTVYDEDYFSQYMTKNKWFALKLSNIGDYNSQLFHHIFIEALRADCDDEYDSSVVKAHTALELATEFFLRKSFETFEYDIKKQVNKISALDLRSKVVLALAQFKMNSKMQSDIFNLVEVRNRIVHEGFQQKNSIYSLLESLKMFINSADESITQKVLSPNPGNSVRKFGKKIELA